MGGEWGVILDEVGGRWENFFGGWGWVGMGGGGW